MAETQHGRIQAHAEEVQNVFNAGLAVGTEAPEVSSAYHHGAGSQCKRLGHIATAANAAIEQNLNLVAHGVGHGAEAANRCRCCIQVVSSVIGDGDGVDASIHSALGVIDARHAFKHELAAPLFAQPLDVFPRGRGSLLPLAIGAEERGSLARGWFEVGCGQIRQPGCEPLQGPLWPANALGGKLDDGAEIHSFRDGGASPVATNRERPVGGGNKRLDACRTSPFHALEHDVARSGPVHLKERVFVYRGHFFDRLRRKRAQAHDRATVRGRLGDGNLTLRANCLHASGRDHHRQGDGNTHDGRGKIPSWLVSGHVRRELHARKSIDVLFGGPTSLATGDERRIDRRGEALLSSSLCFEDGFKPGVLFPGPQTHECSASLGGRKCSLDSNGTRCQK